jgi:hypothetical protein
MLLGVLPAGTIIGSWRLLEARGRGAYGTVYRAERVGHEAAGPVALKLAHCPMDPRFEREVELLSRVRHPSIPQLLDHGVWTLRDGVDFPFIVMDWIEGLPLYTWVAEHQPGSIQVLGLLAQVAGALAALHREDCVHRDVKGDNVLVNAEGRAFLMDFGAGDFKGSRSLTEEVLPPGTPEYCSPEAQRFQWDNHRVRGARYKPGPADDVYALGVTAYRMVTGDYPPPGFDMAAQVAPQEVSPQMLLPPSARVTVSSELDALILRMLSKEPGARGTAGKLARAFEQAANSARLRADTPIGPCAGEETPKWASGPVIRRYDRWLAAMGIATGVVALILVVPKRWMKEPAEALSSVAHQKGQGDEADAGAAALGDSSDPVSAATGTEASSRGLGLDMPKKPFPGQRLPPCREGFEVDIELTQGQKNTRSCWFKVDVSVTACKVHGYEYRGGCYAPSYPPPKVPQSVRP